MVEENNIEQVSFERKFDREGDKYGQSEHAVQINLVWAYEYHKNSFELNSLGNS